jgi:hypothetical protein
MAKFYASVVCVSSSATTLGDSGTVRQHGPIIDKSIASSGLAETTGAEGTNATAELIELAAIACTETTTHLDESVVPASVEGLLYI